jgi:hypothetical protein
VLAIGDGEDGDVDAAGALGGDEATRGEGFVVGVRDDDEHGGGGRPKRGEGVEVGEPVNFACEWNDHRVG